MDIRTTTFEFDAAAEFDMVDMTSKAQAAVAESGFCEGSVTLFAVGATAAVTAIEYEPGLVMDMEAMLERIAPAGGGYHHDADADGGNGHSHLRASLLGPSLVVPFSSGRLMLGTWQQVVLVNLDNRRRARRVVCQVTGK
jgi:secondary thiamine-phosphate synthase enzyme